PLPVTHSLDDRKHRPFRSRWGLAVIRSVRLCRGTGVVGLVLAATWLAWMAVSETYIRTYCLQVRVMEHTHQPRGECPIVKLARESPGGWGSLPPSPGGAGSGGGVAEGGSAGGGGAGGGGAGAGEGGGEEKQGPSFGIVLMCDKGMWPEKYTEMSVANKQAYADLHGYDVIVATSADVDHTRPAAWSKLLVMEKHLGEYDYLIFVDIDAFIMNPAFKLEWLLDVARKQQQTDGTNGWG
ncbi:unnamed protein product, partial [Laminaria digitata]